MSKMKTQVGVLFLLTLWVVTSDAWFWSWTGTTTLAPTMDNEGSGSPVGSGEPPSESTARVGAEIIDEGHGIQKVLQTSEETTEAPRMTTTTQSQNGHASEKETAGISSQKHKPGNGTSSLKGNESEGSDHLKFTGNVSRPGTKLDSKLVSDTGAGHWSASSPGFRSKSGFGTGRETTWRSEKSKQGEVMPTDHRRVDGEGSLVSQAKEQNLMSHNASWIIHKRRDNGHNPGSNKIEQNLDFPVKTHTNIRENRKHNISSRWNENNFNLTYSHKNSTQGDLITPVKNIKSSDHQSVEVTQLSAGESTTKHKTIPNPLFQTTPALFTRKTLILTQPPTSVPKLFYSQLSIANKKAETTAVPIIGQPQVLHEASSAFQSILTNQNVHISNNTQIVSESEPSPATLISQTAVGRLAAAKSHIELAKPAQVVASPQCLLLDTALPFCSSMVGEWFVVPNYLNQTTVEEVQVLLNDWTWLLKSRCHHSLEWFFCLLLVPKCGSVVQLPVLPCRSFCEVLRDSCWTLLDEGRLPVECHTLPDKEDDGYQCLSISNQKGNDWFK